MEHKNHIEARLIQFKNKDESVYGKYEWLASYHNYFCDSIRNYPVLEEMVSLIDGTYTSTTLENHLDRGIYISNGRDFGIRKIEPEDMKPYRSEAEKDIHNFNEAHKISRITDV